MSVSIDMPSLGLSQVHVQCGLKLSLLTTLATITTQLVNKKQPGKSYPSAQIEE